MSERAGGSGGSDVPSPTRTGPVDVDAALDAARHHGPVHHHRPAGLVGRLSGAVVGVSMARPKAVFVAAAVVTALMGLLFLRVDVDTDPENMLAADAPIRVLNAEIRETFDTRDLIVVGIFSDEPLTDRGTIAAAIDVHDRVSSIDGVSGDTMISPRTAASGRVASTADAESLVERVAADPLLAGNVISADGDTLAFFIPLDAKSDAVPVSESVDAVLDDTPELAELERRIAGLPLAQEAFGDQMFLQMAVFAPLAGAAIFVVMLLFFRRLVLVGPAMLLAMLSVVWAMGLLIGSGNTLHIMSSMIPIFLMPIAILDAIHIISEFFDRYGRLRDQRAALRVVYDELAGPIAFTSITTVVGFAALTLTPIPPVRVFGIFIAVGVVFAWLLTLTVLPAVLVSVRPESIERAVGDRAAGDGWFAAVVRRLPVGARRNRRAVLGVAAALAVVAVPLIARIEINDNPVKWFRSGHDVRVATERLNDELPGTFGANLIVRADAPEVLLDARTIDVVDSLQRMWDEHPVVGASASYVDLVGGAVGPDAAGELDTARRRSALARTLVTDDDRMANIRLQLRDGDNQAMQDVLDATDRHLAAAPFPDGVTVEWGGETYLNLVWQDEMVDGMVRGFLVTLAIVMVLLGVLFRSVRWAIVGIAPVLWTVLVVYGAIGLLGKDFDMPIAVLSTLVLGIGVDFAIHFVERFRELRADLGDGTSAIAAFAEEPARALTRNAVVIAVGFVPLLFSSLTPYVIVGLFIGSIILLSWLATVVALPAVVGRDRRLPASGHESV